MQSIPNVTQTLKLNSGNVEHFSYIPCIHINIES